MKDLIFISDILYFIGFSSSNQYFFIKHSQYFMQIICDKCVAVVSVFYYS